LPATSTQSQVDAESLATSLMAYIREPLLAASQEIGERAVAEIQESLSVPVERLPGGVVIRSAPGEPPRMETGALRENVEYVVLLDDEGVPEIHVMSDRPPQGAGDQADAAAILEYGGVNQAGREVAPRPYMAPEADRIAEWAPEVVARHIAQHFGTE
jgi:hypothetical protein